MSQPPQVPIYLDYNATTPLAPSVRDAMIEAMYTAWHNPSSASPGGAKARSIIDQARLSVARLIGCRPEELTFTSGGTESNSWAVKTSLERFRSVMPSCDSKPHVVATCVEHDAIRLPLERLERLGRISVTWLPVDPRTGALSSAQQVVEALRFGETCLVTVMWANNETGALFPIEEIGTLLSEWRQKTGGGDASASGYASSGLPLFHTDACQAVGKVPIDVFSPTGGPDLLSLAAHKFQGPKGVGALFASAARCPAPAVLQPMFLGGGQEGGRRSGTENTPGIAGLGAAAELARAAAPLFWSATAALRDRLRDGLLAIGSGGYRLAANNHFPLGATLPNTLNVSVVAAEAEADDSGEGAAEARDFIMHRGRLLVSAGSACHATTTAGRHHSPSAVLLKSGVKSDAARAALRLSLGPATTLAEVDAAVAEVAASLAEFSERRRVSSEH